MLRNSRCKSRQLEELVYQTAGGTPDARDDVGRLVAREAREHARAQAVHIAKELAHRQAMQHRR